MLQVTTVDYHTAGEPFRIVTGGAPSIEGADVLTRREWVSSNADEIRRLVVNEPRGHAGMYGCHVVPPDDDAAEFGAIFFHRNGYSLACGHGTIALGVWAVESGRVAAPDTGEVPVTIDVPSGRVLSRVRTEGSSVVSAVFRNVPAYVTARRVEVATSAGSVAVDVAWGGAAYASVAAADLGVRVVPEDLTRLVDLGRQVKTALEGHPAARHRSDDRLSGIYGTIIWECEEGDAGLTQRNVTVFADGQVDRSPCGSGTSARLAILHADGEINEGTTLVHRSILGTTFLATVVGHTESEGHPAVVTEVEGTAHRTGNHEFLLDDSDDLGTGFQLF